MKYALLAIAALTLSSCATMPGGVRVEESKVDGTREISLEPGWLYNSQIKVGLHQNTKMKPDEVLMEIQLSSAEGIEQKDSLVINIDGDIKKFSAADSKTHFTTYADNVWSSRRYMVDVAFVKKMLEGKSVWMKVNTRGPVYIEGEFSKGGFTTAKDGFPKFLAELEKRKPAAH